MCYSESSYYNCCIIYVLYVLGTVCIFYEFSCFEFCSGYDLV
jgi:hypothetical protein